MKKQIVKKKGPLKAMHFCEELHYTIQNSVIEFLIQNEEIYISIRICPQTLSY